VSTWSAVNIRRAGELIEQGLMHPAGMKAFAARREERPRNYSFEQERVEFETAQQRQFKANRTAWKLFQTLPRSYRRVATWWVASAKREETRSRRLAALIESSERGEVLPQFLRQRSRPARQPG
jgi:uncharacterized protein YdeI (YjbR/CyaY-like superfamily)